MRYVFVSDVHGMYYKLMEALDAVKFNEKNDTLVCLGDMFDRGPHSKEILEYVMALPHKILIWGNHDRRLFDLVVKGRMPNDADWHNGVYMTIDSFCEDITKTPCTNIYKMHTKIEQFQTDDRARETYKLLLEYFDNCVWGLEFADLIAVHAWIPLVVSEYWFNLYEYGEDWRDANTECWDDAVWYNPVSMLSKEEHLKIGKKLLVGHIWSWIPAQRYGMKITKWRNNDFEIIAPEELSKPREYHNVIFIDGMANQKEGKVIAYVYENDTAPEILGR